MTPAETPIHFMLAATGCLAALLLAVAAVLILVACYAPNAEAAAHAVAWLLKALPTLPFLGRPENPDEDTDVEFDDEAA